MERNVDVVSFTEAYIKDQWYAMLLPLRQVRACGINY